MVRPREGPDWPGQKPQSVVEEMPLLWRRGREAASKAEGLSSGPSPVAGRSGQLKKVGSPLLRVLRLGPTDPESWVSCGLRRSQTCTSELGHTCPYPSHCPLRPVLHPTQLQTFLPHPRLVLSSEVEASKNTASRCFLSS